MSSTYPDQEDVKVGSQLLESRCRELEAEKAQLAAIVEGSRDAIWSWSSQGIVTRWNEAAAGLTGFEAREIIGQPVQALIPFEKIAAAKTLMERVQREGWSGQVETTILRKDLVPSDVELSVSPLRDSEGNIVGASVICRDITDRKAVMASLANHNLELTTLYHLSEQLQVASSPDEIFTAALDAITIALGCDRASILMFDAEGIMQFVASRGLSDAYREAVKGHSPWTRESKNPQSIFVSDIRSSNEPEHLRKTIEGEGIRSLAFIPLVVRDRVFGKFMSYHRDPHHFTENEKKLADTIARQLSLAFARRFSEEELRDSEQRFRQMSEHAPVMIWMSDSEGRCLHLNSMLRTFWGIEEEDIEAFDWSQTIHPDDIDNVAQAMTQAIRDRTNVVLKGRYATGSGSYRVLTTSARPRFSISGQFLGMIGVNVDVTEREEAERARELLVAELNHRVKNTLSVVQGIAHQTFKNAKPLPELQRAFEGRLVALSMAHNLLTQANWENASLTKLAELTLNPKGSNSHRAFIQGPDVSLSPKAAVSISMALHEMFTNALKYGALSNDSGKVHLRWTLSKNPEPVLQLEWCESDGPPVATPTRKGFGSVLLERTLSHDLGGEVDIEFPQSGMKCRITAPLYN